MRITFDPAKRLKTPNERGLDFLDAARVFEGLTATIEDRRFLYAEVRYITAGFLAKRLVVIVWPPRGSARRIISMRFAHDKETKLWTQRMG